MGIDSYVAVNEVRVDTVLEMTEAIQSICGLTVIPVSRSGKPYALQESASGIMIKNAWFSASPLDTVEYFIKCFKIYFGVDIQVTGNSIGVNTGEKLIHLIPDKKVDPKEEFLRIRFLAEPDIPAYGYPIVTSSAAHQCQLTDFAKNCMAHTKGLSGIITFDKDETYRG